MFAHYKYNIIYKSTNLPFQRRLPVRRIDRWSGSASNQGTIFVPYGARRWKKNSNLLVKSLSFRIQLIFFLSKFFFSFLFLVNFQKQIQNNFFRIVYWNTADFFPLELFFHFYFSWIFKNKFKTNFLELSIKCWNFNFQSSGFLAARNSTEMRTAENTLI